MRLSMIAVIAGVVLYATNTAQWFSAAATTSISGRARVVDVDTVVVAGTHIRLQGLDAEELAMTNGPKSRAVMQDIVSDHIITCKPDGTRSYNRVVATCLLPDGTDIGRELIRRGWGLDCQRYSHGRYRAERRIVDVRCVKSIRRRLHLRAEEDVMKAPRVTPEEAAAFKADLSKLRSAVGKVRRERLKYLERHQLPPLQLLQRLKAENDAALQRLAYWNKVLHSETTREIRSPVRLWDAMNSVRGLAEFNEHELDYYVEQHARKTADHAQ
jgi:hypothetical protein